MGGWVQQHKKSCDMSILGFSIVGISKIISIFLLGYPKSPKGTPGPRGEGAMGAEMSCTTKNSCDMSIMGFSIVGISKMIFFFLLGYPYTPKGHLWVERGWAVDHRKSQNMSILWFSIVENSKTITIFHLGYPHTPHKGTLSGRGLGGPSPMPHKIIFYVTSGNSKWIF